MATTGEPGPVLDFEPPVFGPASRKPQVCPTIGHKTVPRCFWDGAAVRAEQDYNASAWSTWVTGAIHATTRRGKGYEHHFLRPEAMAVWKYDYRGESRGFYL